MLQFRRKGVVKWTIWGVVIAFGLSIFLMAGMFFANSGPKNDDSPQAAQKNNDPVKPKIFFEGEDRNKVVAIINDKELKTGEVESVFNSIDPQYKPKFATEQGIKHLVDQLVNEKIKMQLAKKIGIDYEADQEIQKIIDSQESDTNIKKIGGFKVFIESKGYNWDDYKNRMKAGIVDRMFREKITQGKAVTDKEVEEYYNKNKDVLYKETEIENVRQSIKDILKAEITDADVKSFYEQYDFLFKAPMQIKLSQILIDPENSKIKDAQTIADEEIKKFYDENKKEKYKASKAFTVQQILVKHTDVAKNKNLVIPAAELKKHFEENIDKFKLVSIDTLAAIKVMTSSNDLSAIKISDQEIKDYYDSKKDFYTTKEQAKASHVLIKVDAKASDEEWTAAEKKCTDLIAKVKAGEKFEDLAKECSECPSKTKGGDLGWFGRGQMVPAFEKVAFALKEGELSEPVKTKFGYHVIKGMGYKAAAVKTLDLVKDEITRDLQKEKDLKETKEIAENIAKNAVTIKDSKTLATLAQPQGKHRILFCNYGKVADGKLVDPAKALAAKDFGVTDNKIDNIIYTTVRDLDVNKVSDPVFIDNAYIIVKVLKKDTEAKTEFSMVETKVKDAYLPEFAKKFYKEKAVKILAELKAKIAFAVDTKENIGKAGKIFADHAAINSDGKTKNAGGSLPRFFDEKQPAGMSDSDMGVLKSEIMAGEAIEPEIKKALENTKDGDFTDVIETPKGFHIIFVNSVENIDALPYGLVKIEIQDELIKEKSNEAAKSKAQELVDQLKKGGDFAALAKVDSDAKSAALGGSLGFIPLKETIEDKVLQETLKEEIGDTSYRYDQGRFNFGFYIEPEITQGIKFLEAGQISDVIKTRFGYHILKLEQVKDGALATFDEVKDSIKKDYLTTTLTEADLKKIYEQNIDSYKVGESATVRQAVCGSEREAKKVLEMAKEGKDDYVDIIKKYSRSPSASKGGLMTAAKGEMYQVWEDAVFALNVGDYSEPIHTTMGWHVVRMESKQDARVIPFEEKKDEIRKAELDKTQGEIYSRFLEKLNNSTRAVYEKEGFILLDRLKDIKYK